MSFPWVCPGVSTQWVDSQGVWLELLRCLNHLIAEEWSSRIVKHLTLSRRVISAILRRKSLYSQHCFFCHYPWYMTIRGPGCGLTGRRRSSSKNSALYLDTDHFKPLHILTILELYSWILKCQILTNISCWGSCQPPELPEMTLEHNPVPLLPLLFLLPFCLALFALLIHLPAPGNNLQTCRFKK